MATLIKEATQSVEEIENALDNAQRIYNLRNEELHDEELWGAMSKSVKKQYFDILKNKELEIAKLQRRLERAKLGQPQEVEVEESISEGIIGDLTPEEKEIPSSEFDIEKEIIASEESKEEDSKETTIDNINLRREIENLINSTEDILTNDTLLHSDTITSGLKGILSKFKEIRDEVESNNLIEANSEITLIKLGEEDVNSDSDITAIPPISDDERSLLKGNLQEENEQVTFTNQEVEDVIRDNWYVYDERAGEFIVEVHNNTEYSNTLDRYKIKISYEEPTYLEVTPKDHEDKASLLICDQINKEILYQLKLNE